MSKELKPCPFCGEVAKIKGDKIIKYYVACTNKYCFCSLGEGFDNDWTELHAFSSKDEAADEWNKRATNPAKSGQ